MRKSYLLFLFSLIIGFSFLLPEDLVYAQNKNRLKGRIERIFVDGKVSVPKKLQAQQGKFDIRILEEKKKPRILHAKLKSFPAKLRGEWKGTLKVVAFEVNPENEENVSAEERSLLQLGRLVNVKFRFYTPRSGQVSMAPPVGKFVMEPGYRGAIYLPMLDPSTGQQLPPPGGGKWTSLDKQYSPKTSLLLNKVRMLASNKVEQDLFIHSLLTHRRTGARKQILEEHIYQFERVGSFHLKVNLAEVHYDKSGVWIFKSLYSGDVH